eukprot:CAMPEP_0117475346 /NCGR_PEP_ID=MMETSP0784-20121206/9747_1 /TAXON_ID=39447 /ORGANISM="" /LENGTH=55 /DNA_ID=CAMNT_0005269589 /DNA_START=745 /DNA_END=912 /DNA_ORIENTATION=+
MEQRATHQDFDSEWWNAGNSEITLHCKVLSAWRHSILVAVSILSKWLDAASGNKL